MGLGGDPVSLVVIIDDGGEFELATSRDHSDVAIDPLDAAGAGVGP